MQRKILAKIKPFLTLIGLTMIVGSGVISYYEVKRGEQEMMVLQSEVRKKEALIQDVWSNVLLEETRIDTAVMVALLPKSDASADRLVRHYYAKRLGVESVSNTVFSVEMLDKLLSNLDASRQQTQTTINQLYDEKVKVEERIMQRQQENSFYSSIMLMMQLLGVVLITLSTRNMV